jgi:hypothetical protein
MAESPEDDIADLLRQSQQASDPMVTEFAWVWLEAFRRDAIDVLRQQRQEGRAAGLHGDDLESVRRRTEERLGHIRTRLLGRLQRLMTWARETGRAE